MTSSQLQVLNITDENIDFVVSCMMSSWPNAASKIGTKILRQKVINSFFESKDLQEQAVIVRSLRKILHEIENES